VLRNFDIRSASPGYAVRALHPAHPGGTNMSVERTSSIRSRWLDPTSSLGEIMFGLIMTLTFTLGAGIIIDDEGREGARELLIALIGCNIAWGVIDGALYLVGQMFDRGRLRRVGQAVRTSPDEKSGAGLVANELEEWFEDVMKPEERQALYSRIASNVRAKPQAENNVTKADFMGAWVSFWLVVLASLPAALPFLIWDDARFALRVSNGILLASLFIVGSFWARQTMGKPWLVGLSFLTIGFALVWLAIQLGG
jgi:hypothetical protein